MGKKSGGRVRVKQVGGGAKMPQNPLEGLSIPPEEMIHLPPKPDTNISHVWPMNETFSMEYKQFSMIYPNYLDSTKSVKRGRRIAAEQAVPHPSVQDIGEALQSMGIRHVVQPYKGFSRDPESQWDNLGRVLVDMEQKGPDEFDADNLPDIHGTGTWKKKTLLRGICERIPSLPGRLRRLQQAEQLLLEAEAKEAEAQKVASQKAATSAGTGKKKKGKGKKKR